VENLARPRHVIDAGLDAVACDELARDAPALDEIELLLDVISRRANRVVPETRLRQALLNRGHRLGVLPLRIPRILRARLDADRDERAIGRAADRRLAHRDDDRL